MVEIGWSSYMIHFDYSHVIPFLRAGELEQFIRNQQQNIESVLKADSKSSEDLGWIEAVQEQNPELLTRIEEKAQEVREHADLFVLIGVGGSNQGARATIQALSFREQSPASPKILYTGNNLSPSYLNTVLRELEGRSIYCNVIAKNFATLEPGSIFRVIRQYLEKRYGAREAATRIIATASLNGSHLEALAKAKGYTTFECRRTLFRLKPGWLISDCHCGFEYSGFAARGSRDVTLYLTES
jgi:glucose-6-phosphate isomerase